MRLLTRTGLYASARSRRKGFRRPISPRTLCGQYDIAAKGEAMSESTNTEVRQRLGALVGEWAIEAGPPEGPPWPGEGRVTFEWLDGAPLLIERSHVDLPEAPDGVAVIGCDGMSGTYYQLYTDDRRTARRGRRTST
jgi:hypothetical protein